MEDEKLVKLALDGDDDALRTLHDRYVQPMFHYVYVQTGNHHDSEELIQDIFFKMARNLAKFQGNSSFKTWIFAISRNVVIDFHRKQKKHKSTTSVPQSTLEAFTEKVHSAEDQVIQKGLKKYLLQTMDQLPTDYQTVLHLRFVEEFSVKETAEIMSKTTFSVKSLQHRARKRMVSLIRNEVGEG